MKPRIYVYRITFKEVPNFYHGWHKEKSFNEAYWGSPVSNKHYWTLYTPIKEIICEYPFTDEGARLAKEHENSLIGGNWQNPLALNRNNGGHFYPFGSGENCPFYGTIWITTGEKGSDMLIPKDSEIPEGYRKGRSIDHKIDPKSSLGTVWITDGTVEGTRKIPRGSDIPEGYRLGRPGKTMWITDGTASGDRLVSADTPIPEGFFRGRTYRDWINTKTSLGTIWITDGTVEGNKKIPKDSPIPEGYKAGRKVRNMWITDGTAEGNKLVPKESDLPEGFKLGRTSNTMWITDGTPSGNKKVPRDSEIPEGFKKGRALKRTSSS